MGGVIAGISGEGGAFRTPGGVNQGVTQGGWRGLRVHGGTHVRQQVEKHMRMLLLERRELQTNLLSRLINHRVFFPPGGAEDTDGFHDNQGHSR